MPRKGDYQGLIDSLHRMAKALGVQLKLNGCNTRFMDDDGTAQERASLGLDDQEIGKYMSTRTSRIEQG